MKPSFKFIRSEKIEESLIENTRQYLVGNLSKPQILEFYKDKKVEIGITKYSKESHEDSHYHSEAYEYQLMLSGMTKYYDISNNIEHTFYAGDFYLIEPGVKYAQKSKKGTELIFIKIPSINDKIVVEQTNFINEWLKDLIKTVRIDHYYNESSPKPNSIKPAVSVAILNHNNQLLLLKRKDNEKWTLPGGTLEFGENLVDCGKREVLEETNLSIQNIHLVGTYTDPNILIEYSDGEVRQEFTFMYLTEDFSGDVKIDNESKDFQWINFEKINQLSFADSQKRRIEDLINYLKNKEVFLR